MAETDAEQRLQAAAKLIAADDVAALLEDARTEARERVREVLVDALMQAMLDRVTADATKAAAPNAAALKRADRDRTSQPEADPQLGTAVYAYCVIAADADVPEQLEGVYPSSRTTVVSHGALAAVVSEVPLEDFGEERLRERLSDMQWLERTARAHERVLDTIARVTTLIPMRLCSVYRDRSGVAEMLTREADALWSALEHLEGKAEWGVKVFAMPSRIDASTRAQQDVSGTDYMRRRQDERDHRRDLDQELHEACIAIHERLGAVACEALTSPPQRADVSGHEGEMLLNGVYLVDAEQRDTFTALVEQLADDYASMGLDLQLTGPWPGYNFVPGTIGAAW